MGKFTGKGIQLLTIVTDFQQLSGVQVLNGNGMITGVIDGDILTV